MKQQVFIPGYGSGVVEDLVVDPSVGDIGFAVRFADGSSGNFCAGMVQAVNPFFSGSFPPIDPFAASYANPSKKKQPYFPALGAVELDQPGKPDVYALRLPKIPKKVQLSDLLGVPVEWSSKGRLGFYVEGERGPVSLGGSFREALSVAVQEDRASGAFGGRVAGLSSTDIDRLGEEAELKKWGVINPSPVPNQARVLPRPSPMEQLRATGDRFPPLNGREGMIVQSILFPLEDWTEGKAKRWLRDHGYQAGSPEYGATVMRFLQVPSDQITPGSWSTVPFGGSDIQAVVGIEKGGLPGWWKANPTGYDESGKKVVYVRGAGPSEQMMLRSAVGEDIRYYFPGDRGSPDPSRGGFWSKTTGQYLGKSFDEAYVKMFGAPGPDIEQRVFSGATGAASSSLLSGGDTVLVRVQQTKSYDDFLRSLLPGERDRLAKDSMALGFVGGLPDLYDHLLGVLVEWGRSVNPDPRFPNPPQSITVSGPVRPIGVSVDSLTGRVLGSVDLPGLAGLVVSPELTEQYGVKKDVALLDSLGRLADWKNIDEAWVQFENMALSMAGNSPARGSLVSEYDSTGALFEGVREFYELKKPVKTLEEAIKTIIKREGVKRWEEFPMWLVHQMGARGLWDWLVLPEGRTMQASLEAGALPTRGDLERDETRLYVEAIDRFLPLRVATDMLGYYVRRLEPNQAQGLINYLRPYLAPSDRSYIPPPFTRGELDEFATLLQGALHEYER